MFNRRIEARSTVSNDRDRGSSATNSGRTDWKIPQGCSQYPNKANAMSTDEHHIYTEMSLNYGKAEYHQMHIKKVQIKHLRHCNESSPGPSVVATSELSKQGSHTRCAPLDR